MQVSNEFGIDISNSPPPPKVQKAKISPKRLFSKKSSSKMVNLIINPE